MKPNAIFIIAGLFLLYSLFSKVLSKTSFTAPMLFTASGVFIAFFSRNFFGPTDINHGTVHILAEITLIFVLFIDAAQINLQSLRKDHILPKRLLFIGMPLTIVFGTIIAFVMFDKFLFWEAALLAAILAPTDAALGQAVVTSKDVPDRIRQTLSVESGLNDGIALPIVLILASLTSSMGSAEQGGLYWVQFTLMQVVLGPIVGLVIGLIGSKLVAFFVDKNWMSHTFEGISALSIALIAFTGAELVHGNGFIAAFVAGLAFGNFLTNPCKFLYEFAEGEGQIFTLATFFIFGTLIFSLIGSEFQWLYLIYGVLSLTIIRLLPVAISLIGTGVNKYTVLFLGWFGPRGLASILFSLLILERMEIMHAKQITSVVIVTILLSIFLHGITAAPASRKYGLIIKKDTECEEMKPI